VPLPPIKRLGFIGKPSNKRERKQARVWPIHSPQRSFGANTPLTIDAEAENRRNSVYTLCHISILVMLSFCQAQIHGISRLNGFFLVI
jgi:hypothetical protein